MKKLIATALICALAASAQAEVCGLQTDKLAVIIDASGSMMQTFADAKEKTGLIDEAEINGQKISQAALDLTQKLGEAAGENRLNTELLALAPFAKLLPVQERSGSEFAAAAAERFNPNMEVFGRSTVVGARAGEYFSEAAFNGSSVIFITDGGFTDEVLPLQQTFTQLRENNPDMRLYLVSAAYSAEGKAQVQVLSALTGEQVEDLETLMTDEEALQAFAAKAVFNPCVEPQPAVIDLEGVNFNFDNSELDDESQAILAEALKAVEARPADQKMRIEAWTDSLGSDAYNARLSQKRAEVVKDYLVEHGIDADRIEAAGMGKSFKFDNNTEEGRRANRRAEIVFL